VFLLSLPGADASFAASFGTPAYLNTLAGCAASSEIFTTTLAQVLANGISVSISTDGSVRFDDIEASPFVGIGYPVIQTGNGTVQNVRIVRANVSQVPLNTTVISGPLAGMTTSYRAFAVAMALPDSPATSVPTLSEWGMFLLAGLLAGTAVLALRGRPRCISPNRPC